MTKRKVSVGHTELMTLNEYQKQNDPGGDYGDFCDVFVTVPRIRIRQSHRSTPLTSQDDTLESVTRRLNALWGLLKGKPATIDVVLPNGDEKLIQHSYTIDRSSLFGRNVIFYAAEHDYPIEVPHMGDGRVAIANFAFLKLMWSYSFTQDCLKDVSTYPPVAVLNTLVSKLLGDAGTIATMELQLRGSHLDAIQILEQRRSEAVAILAPTMELFLASLTLVESVKPVPKSLVDDVRNVCKANPRIKRDDLARILHIGSNLASAMLDKMRDEGIVTSRKRKSPKT